MLLYWLCYRVNVVVSIVLSRFARVFFGFDDFVYDFWVG